MLSKTIHYFIKRHFLFSCSSIHTAEFVSAPLGFVCNKNLKKVMDTKFLFLNMQDLVYNYDVSSPWSFVDRQKKPLVLKLLRTNSFFLQDNNRSLKEMPSYCFEREGDKNPTYLSRRKTRCYIQKEATPIFLTTTKISLNNPIQKW
ncbi:hypothetical protein L6164_016202 [Bauhinia variegata]|uniref:Uncharacterized protein n=1 Tax=Bauhinia variegata TaxID=167791 RepID=A0ACB9NQ25_BAUVA|nr:hypothetical protein L6164_016202 [Bauhinia variegata]